MSSTVASDITGKVSSDRLFEKCMYEIAENQDKSAFSIIFKHFSPRLKSYFIKAGAADNQAEEIIQEVMISVWTKASSYDKNKSSVSTWLYTIARNKRIDKIRKEKRHYMLESDEGLEIPVDSTQEEEIMSTELSKKVDDYMKNLPKEQAKLLKLSYFNEKTHVDIAKELNIPLGTVKSRIRLALSKIKNFAEVN
jgi:RNA polymerase sigma-70 factor (ECF subfamily)